MAKSSSPVLFKKSILLLVIYMAFISLGLPDSLLGAAWPAMFEDLGVPVDYGGIIFMIIAAGTVISSLLSGKILQILGYPLMITLSVSMTALALMGFSFSGEFIYLCLLAIPLGLGAGGVDSALNTYVAINYQAKQMNWLHSFWGVGAAVGPIIIGSYLAQGNSWSEGYSTIASIQLGLVLILALSFPLWLKSKTNEESSEEEGSSGFFSLLRRLPGLKHALFVFFCYCTIEASFGMWGASFLVFVKNYEVDQAARLTSLYFFGITLGRFFSGFLTAHFTNRQLVYLGQGVIGLGLVFLLLPFSITVIPGFLLVGLGCAPIFPSLLHETPANFGEKHAQSIMGLQMASAYVGITLMPFLFGKIATYTGYGFLLGFLGIFLFLIIGMTKRMNAKVDSSSAN